jgi:hypothetical protein
MSEASIGCGARPQNEETPENTGVLKYRYRDSKPVSEIEIGLIYLEIGAFRMRLEPLLRGS